MIHNIRRHTRIHWIWVMLSAGGAAVSCHIVDDFGNLVRLPFGLHRGLFDS